MSQQRYTQLMTELAATIQCNLQALLAGETVTINGGHFRFDYNPELSPQQLFVYSQYGALPHEQGLEACNALMEANLLLFYNRGPGAVFCISPEDQRVWLADSHELSNLSVEKLSAYLRQTADQATLWRSDYFLAPQPPQSRSDSAFSLVQRGIR